MDGVAAQGELGARRDNREEGTWREGDVWLVHRELRPAMFAAAGSLAMPSRGERSKGPGDVGSTRGHSGVPRQWGSRGSAGFGTLLGRRI